MGREAEGGTGARGEVDKELALKWFRDILGRAGGGDQVELDPALRDVLVEVGLAAFDRQLAFADLVGDRDWQLDQDAGVLRLGPDLVLPAQILGSVSDKAGTWLWAWANPSVEDRLTATARSVAALGGDRAMTVLTDPQVDLARIGDAHLLALAASGLIDADAYYRCPYPGGAAFVIVDLADGRPAVDRDPGARAGAVIGRAVADIPQLVSRASVERYLDHLGARVSRRDDAISIGPGLTMRFDALGRLTGMEHRSGD
jgi:hypothetical protein